MNNEVDKIDQEKHIKPHSKQKVEYQSSRGGFISNNPIRRGRGRSSIRQSYNKRRGGRGGYTGYKAYKGYKTNINYNLKRKKPIQNYDNNDDNDDKDKAIDEKLNLNDDYNKKEDNKNLIPFPKYSS